MIKVKITNQLSGRTFDASFKNAHEAQEWRDGEVSNNSWGKPEREVTDITGLEDRVLSQREATEDEQTVRVKSYATNFGTLSWNTAIYNRLSITSI